MINQKSVRLLVGLAVIGIAILLVPGRSRQSDEFATSYGGWSPPLRPEQQEWRMNYRYDDSKGIHIVSSGYKFIRPFRIAPYRTKLGRKIPAQDLMDWGWKTTVKNTDPNKVCCVEVHYFLLDRKGVKVASSIAGIRLKGGESKVLQRKASMAYEKSKDVMSGECQIKVRTNFLTPFLCTGKSFSDAQDKRYYI